MGQGFKDPDIARLAALHRSIPTSRVAITVANSGQVDLSAVTVTDGIGAASLRDLRGLYVLISAQGADITIQRGEAPNTAGKGVVIVAGAAPVDFFVAPSTTNKNLFAISAAAAELEICWDDEQL